MPRAPGQLAERAERGPLERLGVGEALLLRAHVGEVLGQADELRAEVGGLVHEPERRCRGSGPRSAVEVIWTAPMR